MLKELVTFKRRNHALQTMNGIFHAYVDKVEAAAMLKELVTFKRRNHALQTMNGIFHAYVDKVETETKLKELQATMHVVLASNRLSTKLSLVWKGYRQRKIFWTTIQSILVIQRASRGYVNRVTQRNLRRELIERRSKSIIKMQAISRKYIAREHYLKLYIATTISNNVRNYVALKISSMYRGYATRKRFNAYLCVLVTLQSNFRTKFCRY
jgi:hypothetical protein